MNGSSLLSLSDEQRDCATYLHDNDLKGLSLNLVDFLGFYTLRKERMRERLLKVLGVTNDASPPDN